MESFDTEKIQLSKNLLTWPRMPRNNRFFPQT